MAETYPYASQDPKEIADLVKGLQSCTKKQGGGKKAAGQSKKTTFNIPGTDNTVDSWRFAEWDYKRRDLPIYARGLFTYRKRGGAPEIAIRGYDKFFNVGEVHETNWENVETRTQGPYELSNKENGCIIFIGGLEDNRLLVCSKHSTGAHGNAELSHAMAGEKWVDRQLAALGRTREDLAKELRRRNATAVAELCDDSFEEHVLEYDEKTAGLYLHGINLNLPEFATYPGYLVHQFADEWGFKKAEYVMKDDLEAVKKFLGNCAQTGSWNDRDTEGFVVRCHRKEHNKTDQFHDWFFKYKFEEPYLMYRQWREATKAVIAGKPPRFKKHKQITEDYLLYARRQLAKNPSLGKAYNQNHGIIAMRDGFLQERGVKGSDIIRQEESGESSQDVVTRGVVLVPVATLGCGKTTLAVALTKLFDWGHVQNDNITGKINRPKQFATQVCTSLAVHTAMIADRNNHQRRERKQIMDDVQQVIPNARFVALQYIHDPKPEMLPGIRQITQERVLARGDNHQTIQAGSKSSKEIIEIMEGFLRRFEPVNRHEDPDDGFDEVIDLDVTADSRENLETVVEHLHTAYPKLFNPKPTSEELDAAIEAALSDYRPDIKHDLSFKSNKTKNQKFNKRDRDSPMQDGSASKKEHKPEFFCVKLVTKEITTALDKMFSSLPADVAKFYRQLQNSRRIQPAFHVTLIHRASISSNPELWSNLSGLYTDAADREASANRTNASSAPDPQLGKCQVLIERVVWDHRVMCIVTRLQDEGWETANRIPHITVGTANKDIKPKESNDLLDRWIEKGTGPESGISEKEFPAGLVLDGSVRVAMSR